MSAFLRPDDTRLMHWAKGTRTLFSREWSAFIVSFCLWEKLRSRLSLFSRELGRSSAPRGSGPAAAEAVKRLSSRRSQMELANEFERGIFHLALDSG